MVDKKSIEFLPQTFRTNTNRRFLNATFDQLIQEPNLQRVYGYIGRQDLSPAYTAGDAYVLENDTYSQHYQLEPGLVINKRVNGTNNFRKENAYNYVDLLNAITSEGGITANHSRLFANEYYSWEGFVDLDKLINYSKYYWLPNGPTTLDVNGGGLALYSDFTVTRPLGEDVVSTSLINKNIGEVGYKIDAYPNKANPTITLVRGGTYLFNISQLGHPFWIQTEPGLNPGTTYQENILRRDVFGVSGNGTEVGTVAFTVPNKTAQTFFEDMSVYETVDLVTDIAFSKLQNADYSSFMLENSIDGLKGFTTKTVVLLNNQDDEWFYPDTFGGPDTATDTNLKYDENSYPLDNPVVSQYDRGIPVPKEQRRGIWQIQNDNGKIKLNFIKDWPENTKIFVREGREYGHLYIFKDSRFNIFKVPNITASRDLLYYQDGVDANVYGEIRLVDPDPATTLDISEIIGAPDYTSPNGVVFSNGLKIKFTGLVTPESYAENEYVVEGVGKAITLTAWASLVTPDPNNPNLGDGYSADTQTYDQLNYDFSLNAPIRKDYILINRSSIDGNAWSRTNRWFHEDVIKYAITFNDPYAAVDLDNAYRGIRPIVEFDANLHLFNHGSQFAGPVTVIDNYITDVANQVEGRSPYVLVYANKGVAFAKTITQVASVNSKKLYFDVVEDLSVDMRVNGRNIDVRTVIESIDYQNKFITLNNPLLGEIPVGSEITFNGDYVSDDVALEDGTRVIFLKEQYANVRNKIYEVKNIKPHSGPAFNQNTKTGSFTAKGSQILYFSSVEDLFINMKVSDSNGLIPPNTVVISIDTELNTVSLNNKVSDDISSDTAITFSNTEPQIHLIPLQDMAEGDGVVAVSGIVRQNSVYWWHNSAWQRAQQKFSLNQSPLFDVFNLDGISWGDTDYYPSSTFEGSKLFGYKEGTGTRDVELGFPLTYRNIGNIGDIVFENFYDTDTFNFNYLNKDQVLDVSKGYVHEIQSDLSYILKNNWAKVSDLSKQYVEKRFVATDNKVNNWIINVSFVNSFTEKNIFVYVNGKEIHRDNFEISSSETQTNLNFYSDLTSGDVVIVRIFGALSSESAKENYTLPVNLVENSQNEIFETLTLGQIRNHLQKIADNSLEFSGEAIGSNNLRDINYKVVPGRILQHSAGVDVAQMMFNNETTNIIKSIDFNRRAYQRFKDRLLYLISSIEFPDTSNPRDCLDQVLTEITNNSSSTQAFYYTDMLPFGTNTYVVNDYIVYDTNYRRFNLINPYDITVPTYQSVLVYLNNVQLYVTTDYTVDGAVVIMDPDLTLNIDDVISIYEYSSTRGCMVPATPTKLGLYPKFTPHVYTDNTYIGQDVTVIQGHDGSKTLAFNDYRDDIVIEFEKRIYNNLNVTFSNDERFSYTGVEPGAFRNTDYSIDEWTQLLSGTFLSWAGLNNVNVFANESLQNDPFSFNYGQGKDKLFGEGLPGFWRGIYKYFFDTDRLHTHPWEMIGLTEKPDWWEVRYGPAPYSLGNEVLWNDMEAGIVYQHGYDSYADARYARPGLLSILPVDTHGELQPPSKVIVNNWNQQTAGATWRFGDQSPQETAWRRSSDYPFAVQIAWALARPAQYCSLGLNRRDLIRISSLDQIINKNTATRQLDLQVTDDTQFIPGTNVWIRDRLVDLSLDLDENFIEIFDNRTINLLYKTSGYTDKSYLQIIADQASPNSTNTGVLVPQENYHIVLSKSAPVGVAVYSAVVVEKSQTGFSVYGFDNIRPYFTIIPRKINNHSYAIKISESVATIYPDDENYIQTIPYGTQLTTRQQVVDFLISYGRYLESSGFKFVDTTSVDTIPQVADWTLAVKEFLYWIEQGWDKNTVISLTPSGTKVQFDAGFGIVDHLTNSFNGSRIIDSSGKVLQNKEYTTYRSGTEFELVVKDQTKGIHLVDMTVVQYEHTIVFDNITVFNDVIYEPNLGNRQYRMKVSGFKTRDWDGSLYAPGFMINHKAIDPWMGMKDYYKGDIVVHKNLYYTAKQFVPGSPKFDNQAWYEIDPTLLQKQLVPNLAFNAQQFENFYDVDSFDVNRYADINGRNSTGFVPRDYLTNMGLDNISQHKFYLGMIREKGTQAAVNAFLRAKLPYLDNNIQIDEQWAIRLGTYGGYGQKQDIEVSLANAKTLNGSYVVELINQGDNKTGNWNEYKPADLLIKPAVYNTNIFEQSEYHAKTVPTTGPVLINEVDYTVYDIQKINNINNVVPIVGEGSRIWIAADKKNDWNVYRITANQSIKVLSASVIGNEIEFTTNKSHGLTQFDNVMIKRGSVSNNSKSLSGFYRVNSLTDRTFRVPNYNSMGVTGSMNADLFVLKSVRYNAKSRFALDAPGRGWITGDKVWIDGVDGNWEVLEISNKWTSRGVLTPVFAKESDYFGNAIDMKSTQDIMVVGAPYKDANGYAYVYRQNSSKTWNVIQGVKPDDRYAAGFGFSLKYNESDRVVIGAPESNSDAGIAYIMTTTSNQVAITQVIALDDYTTGDKFGQAVAASNDGNYIAVGSPATDTVYIYKYIDITETGYYSNSLEGRTTIEIPQQALGKGLNAGDIKVKVDSKLLVPYMDYTCDGTDITISGYDTWAPSTSYTAGSIIIHLGVTYDVLVNFTSGGSFATTIGSVDVLADSTQNVEIIYDSYYQYLDNISGTAGSNFGYSISFANDGTQLAIGAPSANKDVGLVSYTNVGQAHIYERTVETFIANGTDAAFTLENTANQETVYLNGVITTDYTIVGSTITLAAIPSKDSVVTVETNAWLLLETKTAPVTYSNLNYGKEVVICPTTCSLYVGAPGFNNKSRNNGAVYRYVNTARLYGTVSTRTNLAVTQGNKIRINGVLVTYSGTTAATTAADINSANIPGVTATANGSVLKIVSDSAIAFNKLIFNVAATGSGLTDLGFKVFDYYQLILSNTDQDTANFGNRISLSNDAKTLLVGSDIASNKKAALIDGGATRFDGRSTTFTDIFYRSGNAYLYEYQGETNETASNHGNFAFTQTFNNPSLEANDKFSTGIVLTKNWLMITALSSQNNAGAIYPYYNETGEAGWKSIRTKPTQLDSRKIERVYLYNDNTRTLLADLPIIDPEHGMPVPAAVEQIKYSVNYDPAVYSNVPNNYSFAFDTKNAWAEEHVGELWWDTNQIKYVDWNQGDIQTRFNNWGLSFPNSYVSIYEWVESDVVPSEYAKTHPRTLPLYTANDVYTTKVTIDPATLQSRTKYYFWISNSNANTSKKRRDTALAIQNLISNPRNINQPFAAVIGANALALFNCKDIVNNDTVLHISLQNNLQTNPVHEEWSMFDDGSDLGVATEFLDRLNDSLAGEDAQGRIVPDQNLSDKQKYGLGIRPRQTTFADKFSARQTWVNNVNAVFAQYPMTILRDISSLTDYDPEPIVDNTNIKFSVEVESDLEYINKSFYNLGDRVLVYRDSTTNSWTVRELSIDPANINLKSWEIVQVQTYDLAQYWTYTDWYAKQYNASTPITKIIDYDYEIASVDPQIGDVIKIKNGVDGNWKLVLVNDTSLELIGQQNATILIDNTLFDNLESGFGIDSTSFEVTSFAKDAALEFRRIFDIVNYELLTKELRDDYKSIVRTMIDNIATQFTQNDWLLKTSLINIKHRVRELDQIPVYVKQPENIVTSFINEIKPYHTKIKQYISSYDKLDVAALDATDFDLPAYYNSKINKYRQPQLGNPVDDLVITNPVYQPWIENHKYRIEYVDVFEGGSGYTSDTTVLIQGDGKGAEAIAFVRNGGIYSILVTNPGYGYTYANIVIIGVGRDAKCYAKLAQGVARTFDTTMKFDRIRYDTVTKEWAANTVYDVTDLVVYNNTVYRVSTTNLKETDDQSTVLYASTYAVNNGGTNYVPGDKLIASGGSSLSPATYSAAEFIVDSIAVGSVSIVDGGDLYSVGNRLFYRTDNNVPVILTVTSISGVTSGPITGVSVTNAGVRSKYPTPNPVNYNSIDQGSSTLQVQGTGATFNFTWKINSVTMTKAGSYTTLPNSTVSTTTSSKNGSGATIDLAYEIKSIVTGTTFDDSKLIEYRVRKWEPNKSYNKDTIVVYGRTPYVALTDFTSERYFDYNSNITVTNSLPWRPNENYLQGTILSYNGIAYKVNDTQFEPGQADPNPVTGLYDHKTPAVFTEDHLITVFPVAKYLGGYFDDAASRVQSYYNPNTGMPGKDLAQVMTGIDYPGVNIKGAQFDQAPGYGFGLYEQITFDTRTYDENGLIDIYGDQALDSEIHSLYRDAQLGLRPEDMIDDGGAYIDTYSSHAPEELIPGHMFDALDIRIKTIAPNDFKGAPEVITLAFWADDITKRYYFNPLRTNTALPRGGIEDLYVYTDFLGQQIENVNYTVNWKEQYIDLNFVPEIPSTVFMYIIGNSGKSTVVDTDFISDGVRTEFVIEGNTLNSVQQAFVKVNNVKASNWSLLRPSNVTTWLPAATYAVDDYVTYNDATYRIIEAHTSGETFNFDYAVSGNEIRIRFDSAPAADSIIQVHLFDVEETIKAYSDVQRQQHTVPEGYIPNALGYRIATDEPVQYNRPWEAAINVLLNGVYLEPSNQAYYTGTGQLKNFSLPIKRNIDDVTLIQDTDIVVTVDGNIKYANSDYFINNNGVDVPTVTFTTAPAANSKIVVSNRYNSQYNVEYDEDTKISTVAIKNSITILPNDNIEIVNYSNHDQYQFNVEVFSGSLTETSSVQLGYDILGFDLQGWENEQTNVITAPTYTLSQPVNNYSNLTVLLNGVKIDPFYDFVLVTPTIMRVDPAFGITSSDIITVIHISEDTRPNNIEYRIFKGIAETYEYLGIGDSTTTVLTEDFAIDDVWMSLRDVNKLGQPDPVNARPGIVFVNGERITYYVIDYLNNRIGQLRRATEGTGAPAVHLAGTKVYDGGFKVEIPNTRDVYTPAGSSITVVKNDITAEANSEILYLSDTTNIQLGMILSGNYIPEGAKVINIEKDTSIRINKPVVTLLDNVTVEFTGLNPSTTTTLVSSTGNTISVTAGDLIRTGQIWQDPGVGSAASGSSIITATTKQIEFLRAL